MQEGATIKQTRDVEEKLTQSKGKVLEKTLDLSSTYSTRSLIQ
jgi:hypothetical protein